jgi:hypothetical protein
LVDPVTTTRSSNGDVDEPVAKSVERIIRSKDGDAFDAFSDNAFKYSHRSLLSAMSSGSRNCSKDDRALNISLACFCACFACSLMVLTFIGLDLFE